MNNLKTKLLSGEIVYGTWCSMSSPSLVNALGFSGLDYCVLDLEHGMSNFETLENMVRSAEVTNMSPIIRTSNSDKQHILKCLETGINNILIPNISNLEQAEEVVKYCRYQPEGSRGISPYTRCHGFDDTNLKNSTKELNEEMLVGVLVEGIEGLKNLDLISKVQGLDLIYLGLFDVCQSLGLPGQIDHPKVRDKLNDYNIIIKNNKKFSGCMSNTYENANLLKDLNYNFIAFLNDGVAVKNYFTNFLDYIKSK